ncbi:MAG: nickel pincer cofactor biosynthesis protein LarC [Tannerellaceae bacterium]|jgi:uncharacterized protein (TIGR00299 family) protein|nr:nickel pincer cofactor biosynthesis protein LarC [Tannerellaceae bacterium]
MKTLYFDCFAGISGDMTLAAFIDLGVSTEQLINELKKLDLPGWEIKVSDVFKHGIAAKHVDVITESEKHSHSHKAFHFFHTHSHSHAHSHVHRTMADITRLINASSLSQNVKGLAHRIFMRLAVAEAKIHGSTPDNVHFHEVGAVDSIIDIVGTAICIDILSPARIIASTLCDGHGFVNCQHGTIPVPVPAVVEVLAAKGASVKQIDVEGEMMTPTGAAIIAELAEAFVPMPEMNVLKTAYGAGTKSFNIPNLLRLIYGETIDKPIDEKDAQNSRTILIETNIDDTTPEVLAYTMEKLFEAGAKDVYFTPIYMKKCRPATLLAVLCNEADCPAMERILFTETTTIGLRKSQVERTCLPRKPITVATAYGKVQAKETNFNGATRISIEYEDACRLAKEKNIPLKEILRNPIN